MKRGYSVHPDDESWEVCVVTPLAKEAKKFAFSSSMKKKDEVSKFARYNAIQAWCTPKTEKIDMNVILADAFARIIDELLSEPWLGNATTKELLEELTNRIEIDGKLDYRTSGRYNKVQAAEEAERIKKENE